jgi:pyruvate formate lyase activating enzyme
MAAGTVVRGRVFDLQRYSIRDGPGIRTTVFLKGCPLRCDWCQNPESQKPEPESVLFPGRCIDCGACTPACPRGAISPETRRPDPAKCACCGTCVETCPSAARHIIGRDITVDELLDEAGRDRPFYEESGGGITFSGGEPLAQPAFLGAALDGCRERGFHTAVDTCGYAPREQVEGFARRTDLFLYDIKSMDPERHRSATGVPNGLILENLKALCGLGAAVWVRLPLIPGFNDDEENLRATAAFVRSLTGRPPISLLPYHATAADKYRRLGRPCAREGAVAPPPDRVRRAAGLLESLGLVVLSEG